MLSRDFPPYIFLAQVSCSGGKRGFYLKVRKTDQLCKPRCDIAYVTTHYDDGVGKLRVKSYEPSGPLLPELIPVSVV